jgi:hypothetical protein
VKPFLAAPLVLAAAATAPAKYEAARVDAGSEH